MFLCLSELYKYVYKQHLERENTNELEATAMRNEWDFWRNAARSWCLWVFCTVDSHEGTEHFDYRRQQPEHQVSYA